MDSLLTPEGLDALIKVAVNQQLHEIYEWGNENCPHKEPILVQLMGTYGGGQGVIETRRRECPLCWSELGREL